MLILAKSKALFAVPAAPIIMNVVAMMIIMIITMTILI